MMFYCSNNSVLTITGGCNVIITVVIVVVFAVVVVERRNHRKRRRRHGRRTTSGDDVIVRSPAPANQSLSCAVGPASVARSLRINAAHAQKLVGDWRAMTVRCRHSLQPKTFYF